jgi:two-component system, NarL family, invasion response regulator UvrY
VATPDIYKKAAEGCGVYYFCSKVDPEKETMNILRRFFNDTGLPRAMAQGPRDFNPFAELAPRELEVLHYILKGVGTKEISDVLNVKPNTVSTVKGKIFEKTNTSNIVELSELASLYLGRVPY